MGKGIFGFLSHIRDTESGNIFFTLFGAVALVGAVGAASMNVMKGPVKGIADLTNRTIAENNMLASAKLAVSASTTSTSAGDCDNDGFVEPVMFEASTGEPFPAGGGHLPANIGANPKDPWNTRYGYCVWDHGPTALNPACDDPPASGVNNRLAGTNNTTVQTIAVISAGPDRVFQTSCQSFALADAGGNADGNPDIGEDVVVRVPGSDDIVYGYTYAEANNASDDVWRLKSGDSTTAEIGKSLEIRDAAGNVSASISSTQGSGDFFALKTNAIHAKTDPNGTTSDHAYFKLVGRTGNKPLGMSTGAQTTFGNCTIGAGVTGVWSDGTYYYATKESGVGINFHAYNLSGDSFNELATTSLMGGGIIAGGNGKLFVSHGTLSEIAAYSFNGTSFTSLGSIAPGGNIRGIWANDTHVFVTTSGPNALRAYTHTGSTFTLVASFTSFGAVPYGGHVKGSGAPWTVFTIDSSVGVRAFSFNGTGFTAAGSGGCMGTEVTADSSYVYAACGISGLRALHYNGSTFSDLATYDPGMINTAWSANNHVYAGGLEGVRKLRFNGTQFIEIAVDDSAGSVYRIRGSGSKIMGVVSDGSNFNGVELEQQSCGGKSGSGQVDTWSVTSSGDRQWMDIAGAANGGTLVATVSASGYLWRTTNGGASWTAITATGTQGWRSVAASADGAIFVAATMGGNLYTSIDSGATWTARDSVRNWWGVASSSNGVKLAAGASGGLIYTSSNSGVTWTPQPLSGARGWQEIASSADGARLVAVAYNGHIYTSTDSGVNWTERIVGGGTKEWEGVTMSADGMKIIAVARNSKIYTSTNGGVSWNERDVERAWMDVAASSDGTRAAAVEHNGKIYTSKDGGATWIPQPYSPARPWTGIWSTADGAALYAADSNFGRVWVGVEGNGTPPVNTFDALSCVTNQLPRWNGSNWICSSDNDNNSLNGMTCNNGEVVKRSGAVWACGTDNVAGANDNLGNHTATTNLAMGGNAINNIGTITATAYYISSDRNLKDNIKDIVDPHGLLAVIHGRHYVWKKDGKPAYGVIAQDVNAIMPEAVTKTTEGTLAVEYDQLLPAMIEAAKDLKVRNAKLRAEIDALKQQTP